MIRILLDENFNGKIARALHSAYPEVEIIRAQDTHLAGAPDPVLLEWAAQQQFVLFTHDVNTMRGFVTDRFNAGLKVSGVVYVPESLAIGKAIEELLIIVGASEMHEWEDRERYLPL